MAIEFFTGFEGCGSTNDLQSLFLSCAYPATYNATNGFGNSKCSSHSAGYWLEKNCIAAKTKAAGSHIKGSGTLANTNENYSIFRFEGPDIRIFNWTDGVRAYRGTTLLGTGSIGLSTSETHIEVLVYSHVSDGVVQIKINGTLVLDLSGVNTGGADITKIRWGSASNGTYRDNLYISDQFEGELISILSKPSSDDSVQFTPSTGTDNYAMVDETGEDGDSTYVYSGTVGHKDVYGFSDVPAGYVVKGVSVVTTARKSDSGVRTLQVIANQDSVDYDLGSELILTTAYPSGISVNHQRCLDKAPDGTSWDVNKLNAVKWGFEIAS